MKLLILLPLLFVSFSAKAISFADFGRILVDLDTKGVRFSSKWWGYILDNEETRKMSREQFIEAFLDARGFRFSVNEETGKTHLEEAKNLVEVIVAFENIEKGLRFEMKPQIRDFGNWLYQASKSTNLTLSHELAKAEDYYELARALNNITQNGKSVFNYRLSLVSTPQDFAEQSLLQPAWRFTKKASALEVYTLEDIIEFFKEAKAIKMKHLWQPQLDAARGITCKTAI